MSKIFTAALNIIPKINKNALEFCAFYYQKTKKAANIHKAEFFSLFRSIFCFQQRRKKTTAGNMSEMVNSDESMDDDVSIVLNFLSTNWLRIVDSDYYSP